MPQVDLDFEKETKTQNKSLIFQFFLHLLDSLFLGWIYIYIRECDNRHLIIVTSNLVDDWHNDKENKQKQCFGAQEKNSEKK